MLTSVLQRFLAGIVGVTIFVAALAFSVVLFALIAAVGAVALGYVWWRMKFGRRRSVGASRGGVVIIDLPSREVERVDEIPHR